MIARLAALILLLAPAALEACQIPVFRYALERWPADLYELVIYHKGELPEAQKTLIEEISEDLSNVETVPIDLSQEIPKHLEIFGKPELADGKVLARLYFPMISRIEEPLWEGEFTRETYDRLVDSEMRREVLKRLLDGESAVWIILESGNAEKDDQIEKDLRTYLDEAATWLEIPEGVVEAEDYDRIAEGRGSMRDMLRSRIPLKISFDIVRMKRGDPDEELLEKTLLAISSAPPEKTKGEPLAFPIFGRGRTVDSIPGPDLTEEMVGYACHYICGACSCEVKQGNPGADLLMTADWDGALEGSWVVIDKVLPPLAGVGELVAEDGEKEAPEAPAPPVANSAAVGFPVIAIAIGIGAVVLIGLIVGSVLVKRSASR